MKKAIVMQKKFLFVTKPGAKVCRAHIIDIRQRVRGDDVEVHSASKVWSSQVVESIQTKNCIAPKVKQ